MGTLTFDIKQFKRISLDECLNYTSYHKLEMIITNAVQSTLSKMEKNGLISREEKLEYFLQYILLKVSTNNTWNRLSKENNLDQLYLYKVIIKHLFLKDPKFYRSIV